MKERSIYVISMYSKKKVHNLAERKETVEKERKNSILNRLVVEMKFKVIFLYVGLHISSAQCDYLIARTLRNLAGIVT